MISMLPWLLCAVLALFSAYLLLRLASLRKSLSELRTFFAQHIEEESNVLISLSSPDPCARECAAVLNRTLRALRTQRHRYLSGDRALKNAIADVSHDLRTPLTAICGYLELLEREKISPEAARYVAILQERAAVLCSLCEELFRYSLVSSGGQALHPEALSLNALLQESLASAYTLLTERGITPTVSLPQAAVTRTLDREAMSRVLSNLLGNAAKYSGGDLDISLSEDAVICFSNSAPGLSEVEVGRLFERFYTVEAARKSSGLGLAIARSLVERMGGSIRAEYAEASLTIKLHFPG